MSPERRGRSAAEVTEEFNRALGELRADNGRTNCEGRPHEFTDYDVLGETPTPEQARQMCMGCPLYFLCREYAQTTRPEHGVWGGEVWSHRKVVLSADGGNCENAELAA